jgi:hypothetical protein
MLQHKNKNASQWVWLACYAPYTKAVMKLNTGEMLAIGTITAASVRCIAFKK